MFQSSPSYDLDDKLDELRINGYVVFEQFIEHSKIDRIRAAFMPLLEHVVEREEASPSDKEHGEVLNGCGRRNHVRRYTCQVPWIEPFADPDIYEHPMLLEWLERYWETDDFHLTCYHSNTPYPGSTFQHWHRDGGVHKLVPHVGLETCPHFGVKFPLVDTTEENGSFEVLPGTQYLARPDMEGRYDEILTKGAYPTRRLNLRKGDMWIQDPRALHRGTPNGATEPRPELVLCYSLPWISNTRQMDVADADWERLSDRGERMLSRSRRH